MMDRLIAATAAALAVVLRKSKAKVETIGAVLIYGLSRGYSLSNLRWIVSQSALETGYWSNLGTSQDNNVFGMSCVATRKTTQIACRSINEVETSGVYRSISSCVLDRFYWDNYWGLDSHKRSENYPAMVAERYHASSAYGSSVTTTDCPDFGAIGIAWLVVFPLEIGLVLKVFKLI